MSGHSRTHPRIRVAVVLVNDKDQMLFVQHRKGDKLYWLLPGGGLDFGESLFEAGAREVLEETGLTVEVDRLLYVSEAIAPDGSRHILNMYVQGVITAGSLQPPPVDDVITEIAWLPVASLATITMFPAIAEHLIASHAQGFQHETRYLGSRWT